MREEDIKVIRAARQGKLDALSVLVRNYQDFVYKTAYGVLQNKSDAEDVTQETFLKVYQSLKDLRDEQTFPTWLARITVRKSLDVIERKRRQPVVELKEEQCDDTWNMFGIEARLDLDRAFRQLDQDQRTILVLRELHGFDYDQLAHVLDIPIGTVRSRLHHARVKLRRLLLNERGETLNGM